MYKFPYLIGATSSMISGWNRPNETSYPDVCDLRCPYNSTTASQGLEQKTRKIPNPPKCDDTKSPQKINMAQTWPKNQKLNVEGHISSTLTRYERKPIPPNGSWQSTSYTGLLVDIIPLSNGVWDQVYPYRHVVVRNNSLGERDYEPVLIWPRWVPPTGILSRPPYHDKLPP